MCQRESTSRLQEEITLLSELSKAEQRQLKVGSDVVVLVLVLVALMVVLVVLVVVLVVLVVGG